jgi:hypothetical protein
VSVRDERRDEGELVKYLEDLMNQAGIFEEEVKLVVFCPSSKDVEPLFNLVRKRITSYKLIAKYGERVPREDFRRMVKSLAWLLSVDKSEDDLKFAECLGDLDDAFNHLDKKRRHYLARVKEDEDWIHIRRWEGESDEHHILKLLVYKTIKDLGYKDEDIKVEEACRREADKVVAYPVPDLHVRGKIWAEVETLRGVRDPLDLPHEFQGKADEISKYEEFWLVVPSFEIMMHAHRMGRLLEHLFRLFKGRVKVSLWYPDLVGKRARKLAEIGPSS